MQMPLCGICLTNTSESKWFIEDDHIDFTFEAHVKSAPGIVPLWRKARYPAQVSLFEFWRFCFTFCILYFVLHCWASVGDCSCRSVTRSTAFINQGTLDLSCHSSLTLRINPPYIKSRGKNTTFLQTVGLYLWRRPFVLIDIYISFSDCRNLQIVLIVKI